MVRGLPIPPPSLLPGDVFGNVMEGDPSYFASAAQIWSTIELDTLTTKDSDLK